MFKNKLKRVIISFLILFTFQNASLFSQDIDVKTASKFILKTALFAQHPFQLLDGTPLHYTDVYTLASIIPDNVSLIRQAKAWRVVSISMIGVSLASCLFQLHTIAFPNTIDNARFYGRMASWTTLATFTGSVTAGILFNDKLQKSVNNYNLYIMGIPVR